MTLRLFVAFNRTIWNWNNKRNNGITRRITFNRTIWNWNLRGQYGGVPLRLLIVPSGIEMRNTRIMPAGQLLLIVPSGIEMIGNLLLLAVKVSFNRTIWNWNRVLSSPVEPEFSFNRTIWNWNRLRSLLIIRRKSLLIVPSGIEIQKPCTKAAYHFSFNRTIWNWNDIATPYQIPEGTLLIVPSGIEIW